MDRLLRRVSQDSDDRPIEVGFFGGDLWQLERGPRTALLDAAERECRRGRATGIRLTLAPPSVLRAPLSEFRTRGVTTIEVALHTTNRGVLQRLGTRFHPRLGLEAIGRVHRTRMRSIAHVQPGLPGSSHRTTLQAAEMLLRARPHGVRIHPALALSGTLLGELYLQGHWEPMQLSEARATCKHLVRRFREAGTEVVRVGLQPKVDMPFSGDVLAGPNHPDLRLLVESELMREGAIRALTSRFSLGTRGFTFVVNPKDESYLRGFESRTMRELKKQFRLERIRILTTDEQPRGTLRAFPEIIGPDEVPPLRPRRARRAS